MTTQIHTSVLHGINSNPTIVETEVTDDGIGIHMTGLADTSVKESLIRTVTALSSVGYKIPGKKIKITVSPTVKSNRTGLDLAIALGILSASGQEALPESEKYVVLGELGLDGCVRDVAGWFQAAELAKSCGKACILPSMGAKQAARTLGDSVTIYGVYNIREVINILNGSVPEETAYDTASRQDELDGEPADYTLSDWEICGNPKARRAIEIAAAGKLPIMIVGPEGSGKTAYAKALHQLLPPMSESEIISTQRVYSAVSNYLHQKDRQCRIVDHIASLRAVIGDNVPGTVSLAHNGVLNLHQYELFPNSVKMAIRTVWEEKKVSICRLNQYCEYPADFLLAITSSCAPGKQEDSLLENISVQVSLEPSSALNKVPIEEVRARVAQARERQIQRQGKLNCDLALSEACETLASTHEKQNELIDFTHEMESHIGLELGKNTKHILRIARTIADLEGSDDVKFEHIEEAASFRFM